DWLNYGDDDSWVDQKFVGGFRIAPKSLDIEPRQGVDQEIDNRIFSDPNEEWEWLFGKDSRPSVNDETMAVASGAFRLLSDCSIHMHVLSALWIWEVGADLDKNLSESVRGYRLRRNRN